MSYELQDTSYNIEKPIIKHSNHKDLIVYQRAYTISLRIYKLSENFPKTEKYGVTDQLRRSATSICANIAEGYGRQLSSNADFKRFLIIAKGSCNEVTVWIDYCRDLNFIDSGIADEWTAEYLEIAKMLFTFIKKL